MLNQYKRMAFWRSRAMGMDSRKSVEFFRQSGKDTVYFAAEKTNW